MKTLVVLMALVFSASAFANLKDFSNMSPKQIDRMAKYKLDRKDKIWFNQAQFGLHGINSWSSALCTDGTFIYGGTRKMKYCNDSKSDCTTYTVDLVQPINGSRYKKICTGSDSNESCVENKVKFTQPIQRNIPVLLEQSDEDEQEVVVGYKAYSIPSCDLTPVPAN